MNIKNELGVAIVYFLKATEWPKKQFKKKQTKNDHYTFFSGVS